MSECEYLDVRLASPYDPAAAMKALNATLPAGLLNLMQAQQSAAEYGPMYAGLVLVMLPVLILYICVQKNLTKGMTVGGLKG